ncbi:hypothetical protein LWI29_034507 [Acer saccharum]|uniref:Uncharacterized protein n=1 Tax=Acer saccharum TaxID=4024 RepID=A0AA39VJU5_ACESA|nr:hypothetical protein LWI29_034507 [Acer saccharum]
MPLSNKNGEGELRASCLSSPWARFRLKRQRFACLLKCTGELMASVVNSPEARYRLGSDSSFCSMRRAQGELLGLALGSLSSRLWPFLCCMRRAQGDFIGLAVGSLSSRF